MTVQEEVDEEVDLVDVESEGLGSSGSPSEPPPPPPQSAANFPRSLDVENGTEPTAHASFEVAEEE